MCHVCFVPCAYLCGCVGWKTTKSIWFFPYPMWDAEIGLRFSYLVPEPSQLAPKN